MTSHDDSNGGMHMPNNGPQMPPPPPPPGGGMYPGQQWGPPHSSVGLPPPNSYAQQQAPSSSAAQYYQHHSNTALPPSNARQYGAANSHMPSSSNGQATLGMPPNPSGGDGSGIYDTWKSQSPHSVRHVMAGMPTNGGIFRQPLPPPPMLPTHGAIASDEEAGSEGEDVLGLGPGDSPGTVRHMGEF